MDHSFADLNKCLDYSFPNELPALFPEIEQFKNRKEINFTEIIDGSPKKCEKKKPIHDKEITKLDSITKKKLRNVQAAQRSRDRKKMELKNLIAQQQATFDLALRIELDMAHLKETFPYMNLSCDNTQHLPMTERVFEYQKRMELYFKTVMDEAKKLNELNQKYNKEQIELLERIKNLEDENYKLTLLFQSSM